MSGPRFEAVNVQLLEYDGEVENQNTLRREKDEALQRSKRCGKVEVESIELKIESGDRLLFFG